MKTILPEIVNKPLGEVNNLAGEILEWLVKLDQQDQWIREFLQGLLAGLVFYYPHREFGIVEEVLGENEVKNVTPQGTFINFRKVETKPKEG